MRKLVTKSITFGVALVAPVVMAGPAAVNGSLGGFSANAQGGQNPADWGIPQSGQSGAGQSANQSGGQNSAAQGKGPDAGGYGGEGNGQNSQSGGGQNAAGQGKGPDAGGYGNGQNSQSTGGQNGPGQQSSQSDGGQRGPAEGSNQGDGPTKNNSNNPDGSGQGEHANDGPTKNNSNNPDGDGSGQGEHANDGPTKNNSNNPDGGDSGQHGNSSGSGSGSGSSGSSSSGGSGSNSGGDFPPLDPPSDGQYDPSNNGGDQQIPSGCAEAGSQCAQCVQRNEGVVQFNRRYLHVAWSTTHQTLEYTKQAIAFGDTVSGIHSTQALAWQLAGKPQITEAVASLRKTYDNKYRIYINNMEQALDAMNQCEQDNFAVRDLYQRFSSLYLEFVKARYQSPD